jgi:hypothetical protein
MPKKNRSYKKGKAHRDARLFVIVAEGEREDAYFGYFHEKNQRIKVKVVPREAGKSAPNYFVDRVDDFKRKGEWSPEDKDQLWFVMDVDRWKREEIDSLIHLCETTEQWFIAISNPCFEVWLHYHVREHIPATSTDCNHLKSELPQFIRGGFKVESVCPKLEVAVKNAEEADVQAKKDYPDIMQTKLYRLGREMLGVLGRNWNERHT